jgi:GT2 family glycosyltransferase
MVVQNLQFPETINQLYIRACGADIKFQNKRMCINAQGEAVFSTYYNSFALKKWKKYTVVGQISLALTAKGRFEATLIGFQVVHRGIKGKVGGGFVEKILAKETFSLREPGECEIVYPDCDCDLLAFTIKAFEYSELYDGAYRSVVDEDLPDINLALAICTYKREGYIKTNLSMLNETLFSNSRSTLNGHVRVYIADNGQTLKKEEIESETVKLFPNINSGGSGGFSRCMIEALADKDTYNLTHIVLMDDDIFFTHDALVRTYMFLRLLKKEHADIVISGAMLLMDAPHIQHASGEIIKPSGIIQHKRGYDLTEIRSIVLNEIELPVNYCGWWYCCFQLDHTLSGNLPLPLFFQYDDTEWGLRNKRLEKVVVSGVCVRHDSFDAKRTIWKDYYSMRNRLIVATIHRDSAFRGCGKLYFQAMIFIKIFYRIIFFRFNDAELMMMAVEDYCRGIEWLGAVDSVALHRDIQQCAAKKSGKSPLVGMTLTARLLKLLWVFGVQFKETAADYIKNYHRFITEDFWRDHLGLKEK